MGMGDFRVVERKNNLYSKPKQPPTPSRTSSPPPTAKAALSQNKNVPPKSPGVSSVQLTKSGGATASTRPMGMGDLRAVERNLSTNTSKQTSGPANNKSHGSKGMGDLKVIESKKTGNLTAPKSGTSQPSQGIMDKEN